MDENKVFISICSFNGYIRVFRKVIRLLGRPKYIRLSMNREKTLLAIEPYTKKTLTSFEVPQNMIKENASMCIYSTVLCDSLYKSMGWDKNELYRIPGVVLYNDLVAVFELKKAVKYNDEV